MRILVNEKLSEHRYKTPEGYLVCTDAILARTGKQTYKRGEVFGNDCADSDAEVEVDRTEKEVFSDATLASFENKPLTVEHPDENVNVDNHNRYAVGFVRDVKRSKVDGQDVMTGTLVITDGNTIREIENGEHTDLSCGYDCDILDEAHPQQRNIRGNHVALCQQGRAGIARIIDTAENLNDYQSVETSNKRIEEVPLDARKYISARMNKKEAALLAIKSNLEDIINAAEPKIRAELKIKADKIIRDLKAQFDIKDSCDEEKSLSQDLTDTINKLKEMQETKAGINDVNPREGESKDEFISRFMKETASEYPDQKQRYAVALSYWDKNKIMKSKGKDSMQWYRVTIPGEKEVHLVRAASIEDAINKISRR